MVTSQPTALLEDQNAHPRSTPPISRGPTIPRGGDPYRGVSHSAPVAWTIHRGMTSRILARVGVSEVCQSEACRRRGWGSVRKFSFSLTWLDRHAPLVVFRRGGGNDRRRLAGWCRSEKSVHSSAKRITRQKRCQEPYAGTARRVLRTNGS